LYAARNPMQIPSVKKKEEKNRDFFPLGRALEETETF
jgi:hypothetical protein